MIDRRSSEPPFATAAMAKILLDQGLAEEARQVVRELLEQDPGDPRLVALAARAEERARSGAISQIPQPALGRDQVSIESIADGCLAVSWELTEEAKLLARRRERFSGKDVLRLFVAVLGPRGVRKGTRDTELNLSAGRMEFYGLPRPAVYAAAVGFLANTGRFVPLARSEPLLLKT